MSKELRELMKQADALTPDDQLRVLVLDELDTAE